MAGFKGAILRHQCEQFQSGRATERCTKYIPTESLLMALSVGSAEAFYHHEDNWSLLCRQELLGAMGSYSEVSSKLWSRLLKSSECCRS